MWTGLWGCRFPLRAKLMQIREIGCAFDSSVTVTSRATCIHLSLSVLERELMGREVNKNEMGTGTIARSSSLRRQFHPA
jgi:hypothetical protein